MASVDAVGDIVGGGRRAKARQISPAVERHHLIDWSRKIVNGSSIGKMTHD
jgi:hypothetical protein